MERSSVDAGVNTDPDYMKEDMERLRSEFDAEKSAELAESAQQMERMFQERLKLQAEALNEQFRQQKESYESDYEYRVSNMRGTLQQSFEVPHQIRAWQRRPFRPQWPIAIFDLV